VVLAVVATASLAMMKEVESSNPVEI
jgi:hypothetical protein